MKRYRRTRFHVELDFDLQNPPDDSEVKRTIRSRLSDIFKNRYCKARNIKILSKNKIEYY